MANSFVGYSHAYKCKLSLCHSVNNVPSSYLDFNNVEFNKGSGNTSSRGSQGRTCKVWAGVPLIGHGYVNMRYNVSYSGRRFTSGSFSYSWLTGFTIGTYSGVSGEVNTRGREADVISSGTLTYGIDFINYTTFARFKYTDNKPY